MINIILEWIGDWELLINNNVLPFYVTITEVIEMTDNVYMIGLQQPDDFDALELAMEAQEDVFVIGTYNMDGSQYLWGNEVSRNHTKAKYHSKLRNKKEYDQDGNLVVDEPYTLLEAESVQVNKFYGWNDRVLN
jgi:hypothetical protein